MFLVFHILWHRPKSEAFDFYFLFLDIFQVIEIRTMEAIFYQSIFSEISACMLMLYIFKGRDIDLRNQ